MIVHCSRRMVKAVATMLSVLATTVMSVVPMQIHVAPLTRQDLTKHQITREILRQRQGQGQGNPTKIRVTQ